MAYAHYDPVDELREFVRFSDPRVPTDRVSEDNINKIVGRIRYPGLQDFRVDISFNPMEMKMKWLAHQYTSAPTIETQSRSSYVDVICSLMTANINETIFVVGAGMDAPIVHTANLLNRVAKERRDEIKCSIVKAIIEQILFCSPTEPCRKLIAIVAYFNRPIFTENWTRNLSKVGTGYQVNYLFKNEVHLNLRTKELHVVLGAEIDTSVYEKLKNEVRNISTKFIFFMGTSLAGLAKSSIDAIKEAGKKIPLLYVTLMPDEDAESEHLPKSLRRLKEALVLYVDLWKLLPHINREDIGTRT